MSSRVLPPAVEQRVIELLEQAAEERDRGLEDLYREHPEHARRIREILELAADIRVGLEADAGEGGGLPDAIGPFHIVELLGEGGMGSVYLAEQSEPIRRRIALKVIKPGMDTKRVLARFDLERQALARMSHAGIARVFDAGATREGRPYFTMEYVPGEPLTRFCDDRRLTLDDRMEVFSKVCAAVQHAHHKGIIHRDLKPSNILVTEEDGAPVPKVIDFGLARAAATNDLDDPGGRTLSGTVLGTPEYMSPEQLEDSSGDIDTRTDVYALGVILHELLTGTLPFARRDPRQPSHGELRRRVLEEEPALPSTRAAAAADGTAEQRRVDRRTLVSRLSGDLDWIVIKALAKDREERYQSPAELVEDLRRHRANEPVSAGPLGLWYRCRKLLRRYRLQAAAAAVVIASVVGALAVSLSLLIQTRTHAETATRTTDFLVDLFRYASPSDAMGEDISVGKLLAQGTERIKSELTDQPAVRARLLTTFGQVYSWLGSHAQALELLDEALALHLQLDGPDSELVARTQVHRSNELVRLGRTEEGQELLARLLDSVRREHGPRSRLMATGLLAQGSQLVQRGLHERAEPILREALRIQRAGGHDDLDVARTLQTLGRLLNDTGRHEEALTELRGAAELLEAGFPAGHPDRIVVALTRARCLTALGRHDDADRCSIQAVQQSERTFGADHPHFARALRERASHLRRSGRVAEAERLLVRARDVHHGTDSVAAAWIASDLGTARVELGRLREARVSLEHARSIYRKLQNKDHLHHAICLANLAHLSRLSGKWAEAEQLARDALAMQRRLRSHDSRLEAFALGELATALVMQGKNAAADRSLAEAQALADRSADQRARAVALRYAAFCFDQRGLGPQAEAKATACLRILEPLDHGESPGIAFVLYLLGWSHMLQNDRDSALPCFRRSIAVSKSLFPEGHPDVAWPLNYLGYALAEDDPAAAVPFLEEALSIRRASLAPGDYWLLVTMSNLSVAYVGLGRFEDAERLLLELDETARTSRQRADPVRVGALRRLVDLYKRWGRPGSARPFEERLAEEKKD